MNVRLRILVFCFALLLLILNGTAAACGQTRWPSQNKEPIDVRLIALERAYPRTSFFANDEVFVAEQELAKHESRFIKLVYDFLPYQDPLSSYGLNYSLVHHVQAVRDLTCDENLWEMRAVERSSRASEQFRYAPDSPIADLERRQARLRCYRVTSDDYQRASRQPTSEIPY